MPRGLTVHGNGLRRKVLHISWYGAGRRDFKFNSTLEDREDWFTPVYLFTFLLIPLFSAFPLRGRKRIVKLIEERGRIKGYNTLKLPV